jgi:hypothetical protein
MTKATIKKRLDEAEARLTPREWAIRLADEIRKYPSMDEAIKASLKVPNEEAILGDRPYQALAKQAEERHPGNRPDQMAAFNKLSEKLWTEYQTLRNLAIQINSAVMERLEVFGLKAALKLSTLQTVILQDAFGRTASKAALWIEEYKTADEDEEENRQIMRKELSAYTDVSFAEKLTDSLPLGPDIRLRVPSIIEEWVQDTVRLIAEVFSRRAAVKIIQDKFFDGHDILFRDTETKLEETMKTIEEGVATFNEYLMTRELLFKTEWDEEDEEEGLSTAIPGEREGQLAIDLEAVKTKSKGLVKALVNKWIKDAKDETVRRRLTQTSQEAHNEHLRARLRDLYGVEE